MKKVCLLLFAFLSIFLLSNCGGGTEDWPKIELPFLEENMKEIKIDYYMEPYGASNIKKEDHLELKDSEGMHIIYSSLKAMPYNEKVNKKYNKEEYFIKTIVCFKIKKEQQIYNYEITYFGYGVTKGIIVFDNNAHEIRADFDIYGKAKKYLEDLGGN